MRWPSPTRMGEAKDYGMCHFTLDFYLETVQTRKETRIYQRVRKKYDLNQNEILDLRPNDRSYNCHIPVSKK